MPEFHSLREPQDPVFRRSSVSPPIGPLSVRDIQPHTPSRFGHQLTHFNQRKSTQKNTSLSPSTMLRVWVPSPSPTTLNKASETSFSSTSPPWGQKSPKEVSLFRTHMFRVMCLRELMRLKRNFSRAETIGAVESVKAASDIV